MASYTNTVTRYIDFKDRNTSIGYIDNNTNVNHSIGEERSDPNINNYSDNSILQHTNGYIITYYVIILLMGTVLHSTVIYILLTRPSMKEKFIFITSISTACLLFCVIVLPILIAFHATNINELKVPSHVIVCLLVGATSYSMLTTAIRRFLALCERFRFANFTYEGKLKNLTLIWISSLCLSIPYFVSDKRALYDILPEPLLAGTVKYTNNTNGNDENSTLIEMLDGSSQTETTYPWDFVYNIVIFSLQMILPSLISLTLHVLTLRAISRRPNQRHWVVEIRITKQHMCMVTMFLITWVPVSAINCVYDYVAISPTLMLGFQCFSVSLVLYYPVLYFFVNPHIKREYLLCISSIASWMNLGNCRTS